MNRKHPENYPSESSICIKYLEWSISNFQWVLELKTWNEPHD